MTPELKPPCPCCGGKLTQAALAAYRNLFTPDLTAALARLKALEERMGDEKIDVIEIWHNDGIGGMTKTHAIAELSAQRKAWADEIAAIITKLEGK